MISVTALMVIMFTCLIMMVVSGLFSGSELKQSSNEPFECGMDVFISSRTPYALYSYLVLILFVIFDIELIVSIPLVFTNLLTCDIWSIVWTIYSLFMLMGLTVEFWLGSLTSC
uniref:NADH-ubiquinone oxidoreductase chain 3 n=1 Tax=Haematomyzus elephantis TaxID=160133 RepID=A0A0R5QN30_9NEOP|nr:NADH dehydrogenase subunit 3 [Haematomyzus elephantis]